MDGLESREGRSSFVSGNLGLVYVPVSGCYAFVIVLLRKEVKMVVNGNGEVRKGN